MRFADYKKLTEYGWVNFAAQIQTFYILFVFCVYVVLIRPHPYSLLFLISFSFPFFLRMLPFSHSLLLALLISPALTLPMLKLSHALTPSYHHAITLSHSYSRTSPHSCILLAPNHLTCRSKFSGATRQLFFGYKNARSMSWQRKYCRHRTILLFMFLAFQTVKRGLSQDSREHRSTAPASQACVMRAGWARQIRARPPDPCAAGHRLERRMPNKEHTNRPAGVRCSPQQADRRDAFTRKHAATKPVDEAAGCGDGGTTNSRRQKTTTTTTTTTTTNSFSLSNHPLQSVTIVENKPTLLFLRRFLSAYVRVHCILQRAKERERPCLFNVHLRHAPSKCLALLALPCLALPCLALRCFPRSLSPRHPAGHFFLVQPFPTPLLAAQPTTPTTPMTPLLFPPPFPHPPSFIGPETRTRVSQRAHASQGSTSARLRAPRRHATPRLAPHLLSCIVCPLHLLFALRSTRHYWGQAKAGRRTRRTYRT